MVGNQSLCSLSVPGHLKSIRRYLYTANQLERVTKEVKRRTKGVEVFCGEGAMEKLSVLSQLDKA